MASVADELREDNRRRLLAMTASERIALAHRLGDDDVSLYCAAHGVSRAQAYVALRKFRQVGRRPSGSAQL